MMTFEDAKNKAQAKLVDLKLEFGREDLALYEKFISANSYGWVFPYNTIRFIETRVPLDGLIGNRPIFVDKQNGNVHVIPTGSVEKWLAEYALRSNDGTIA